jgi:2Fe-2S ferredoxin
MTRIEVVDAEGQVHPVHAPDGLSLMEILRPLGIGIIGECEGSVACATCHVWVDAHWYDRLPPPTDAEAEMLDCAFHTRPTSRLCCQIVASTAIDGLRVVVAHGD